MFFFFSKSDDVSDGFDKAEIIFNILLNNPADFEVQSKPSAERSHNFMCTMNMARIPLSAARADDNGAYSKRGNTYRHYYVKEGNCLFVHEDEEKRFFYNERDFTRKTKKPSYKKVFVDTSKVYLLKRHYRYSKSNDFVNMIATITPFKAEKPNPYYMYLNKWSKKSANVDCFVVERHGNAKKPSSGAYFKKDPSVLENVRDRLNLNENPSKIYSDLSANIDTTTSVSNFIDKPRVIYNQNNLLKKKNTQGSGEKFSEYENLVALVQGDSFVQSVTAGRYSYTTVNYLPYMLKDMERFCVIGESPWVVDTTFKVAENLWLTDSSYTNYSLLDENGKNPQFPGPSQWHFKKDQASFRRIACEIVTENPKLLDIKKIGHDLDAATANGVGDIMKKSNHLWCTQHLQSADTEKLKQLGANIRTRNRIMSDIYGTQIDTYEREGLADAENENDLRVKLDSLKFIWDEVPGFFEFFKKYRFQKFAECLVLSSRQELSITGRFYSNELELLHKLLKKKLSEDGCSNNVVEVSKVLTTWLHENFLREAKKALIGQGKYRLAEGYQQFFVEPVLWVRWSQDRKNQHFESFMNFVPKSYDMYVKPSDAGRKTKPGEKRRSTLPEPDIFSELEIPSGSGAVTPVKLVRTETSWKVNENKSSVDIFNPHRVATKLYFLVHRKDKGNFPGNVKRCEECKVVFSSCDVIAVKTTATREYTDSRGVKKRNIGNVYLHYLNHCLKGHDQKFEFNAIVILKKTCEFLTDDQIAKLVRNGCTLE